MIKNKLIEYKNSKKIKAPYELRPDPPARIEVDLTEFLTEQNKHRPEEETVKTQTDDFITRPATPKYIPKKTGIDVVTEIVVQFFVRPAIARFQKFQSHQRIHCHIRS